MKRDVKVLKIDLYGCSGIERTKNKVSENICHFNTLLDTEKQGRNTNNFSKVYISDNKRNILINVNFQ